MPHNLIKERDKIIAKSSERLIAALPAIQNDIFKAIANKIDQLSADKEGNIKATTANLKVINNIIKRDAKKLFLDEEYEDAVIEFISSFKDIGKTTKKYYDKLDAKRD